MVTRLRKFTCLKIVLVDAQDDNTPSAKCSVQRYHLRLGFSILYPRLLFASTLSADTKAALSAPSQSNDPLTVERSQKRADV
mgnify:CR=1 FL=1